MPEIPINFDFQMNPSSTLSEKITEGQLVRNMVLTKNGLRNRPSYTSAFADLGISSQQCDGLFWSTLLNRVIGCGGGSTKSIDNTGTVTDLTSSSLANGTIVTFAEDINNIYLANGGRILYSNGSASSTAPINGANTPIKSTHIAHVGGLLISNDRNTQQSRRRFFWAPITDPTGPWVSVDFASANAYPDAIEALFSLYDRLYVFGRKSTQVYKNDGLTPIIGLSGGVLDVGTSATYSIQPIGTKVGDFVFLDDKRRIIIIKDRTVIDIAPTLTRKLNSMGDISNAQGVMINSDGLSIYVLNIPGENLSYAINLENGHVAEWTTYDSQYATNISYSVRCAVRAIDFGRTYVGLNSDDTIHEFGMDYLNDNGTDTNKVIETPVITYGTARTKICRKVVIRGNRGTGVTDTDHTPTMLVYFRKDGRPYHNVPREVNLGKQGDTDILMSMALFGAFKTIQFKIICNESVEFVLTGGVVYLQVLEESVEA